MQANRKNFLIIFNVIYILVYSTFIFICTVARIFLILICAISTSLQYFGASIHQLELAGREPRAGAAQRRVGVARDAAFGRASRAYCATA